MKRFEKFINITLVVLLTISISSVIFVSCKGNKQYGDTTAIITPLDSVAINAASSDTIGNKYDADAQLFELSRDYNIAIDSLQIYRDSVIKLNARVYKVLKNRDSIIKVNITTKEKLGVAEYKLLRIREYNRIAAQGNNLKFLRGWIIRTLNH